ncbi:MAG: amino acid ABC transporter permease [Actinobacteria bacterium]|nr:MAG: amino acid ABC transporter permease [Actinomycetota bacterium]
MTVLDTADRPGRLQRWREEGTRLSKVIVSLGGAALGLTLFGPVGLVLARGATPTESLVATLRSGELKAILAVGLVAGALAVLGGWGTYRRMPTKASREQAVAGAVLGLQAAILSFVLLRFTGGSIEKFATNFLDFRALRPHVGEFVHGARNTLILALAGESIGVGLGLALAMLASSKRAVVRAPARVYINFFRGTPLIWQISFIYFGLIVGFKVNISAYEAAIVAFGLNTGAYAAEVFRAGIQSIDRGQLEAARSLGMSYMQAMRYAVIPQAIRRVIPPLMNEFVILIKDTSLIIVLGLVQREYELYTVGRSLFADTFNATFFVATALGYLVVCLPLIRLVTAVERRLRSGLVGVVGHLEA